MASLDPFLGLANLLLLFVPGTPAQQLKAVRAEYAKNPRAFGPVTAHLIRDKNKNAASRGLLEHVKRIAESYDQDEKLKRLESVNRVLCQYQETGEYDESMDGIIIDALKEMLEDSGVPLGELMEELYDRVHFLWSGPNHRLLEDVPLSVQDWWNSQGGRTLRQSNTDWRAANLPNPVPPPAPVVLPAPLAPAAPVLPPVAPVLQLVVVPPPAAPVARVDPPHDPAPVVQAPPAPAVILIPSGAHSPEHRANVSASGSSNGESDNGRGMLGPLDLEETVDVVGLE
mgnify:CR=1 FL=1